MSATTGPGLYWGRNGIIMRQPNDGNIGPTELFPAAKEAGWDYVALDPKTGDWKFERALCKQLGLDVCPWTQVRDNADLDLLRYTAPRWILDQQLSAKKRAVLINIEKPETRSQSLVNYALWTMSVVGRGSVITDGWVDTGEPAIGQPSYIAKFKNWVGHVECQIEIDPRLVDVAGCIEHASPYFRAVLPSYGIYAHSDGRPVKRSDYPAYTGPRTVFVGDSFQSIADISTWLT